MSKNLIYFAILLALFYGVKPCFAADTAIPSDESIEDSFKLLDQSVNKSDTQVDLNTNKESDLDNQISLDSGEKAVSQPEQKKTANLISAADLLKSENALHGFSVGLIYLIHPYVINATVKTKTEEIKVNDETGYVHNFGVLLKYAIAPFDKIGTDLNISYLTSQNHGTLAKPLELMHIVRGELNLTYAFNLFDHVPVYTLLGGGYEIIQGNSVKSFMNQNGLGGQIGGGLVIASKINIEGLFSYYVHNLSGEYVQSYIAKDKTSEINDDSSVIVKGFIVRTTINF